MPSPSTSLSTLRPELAGTLQEFDAAMDRQGFIGLQVAPVIDVAKQSGRYGKISLEQLLQTAETNRTSKGGYNRSDFTFTDAGFSTEEHGFEEVIDDRTVKLYDQYFKAEVIHTQRAFDKVLRNHEIRVANMIFNASTWTGATLTTSVGTEWSTGASADPIADVEAACRKVWDLTGIWPNALVINRHVFRNLRKCQAIRDRIASSGAGFATRATDITTAQLAEVFDLRKILVAGSAKNTANEGQTASLANIWSNEYAMVCHISDSPDIAAPTIARTFHWSEDGSQIGGTVETYREESARGDVVRVRHETDEVVVYTELGHLLSNITA